MKKILFLILLSFSFLFIGCVFLYKDRFPYKWENRFSNAENFSKVIIQKNKNNNYTLNFNSSIPVGWGGGKGYMLRDVKISKEKRISESTLIIQITPVIVGTGKNPDFFEKKKVYKFDKKMKIRIPKKIKQIKFKFIYNYPLREQEQEVIIDLPLKENQEEILITP